MALPKASRTLADPDYEQTAHELFPISMTPEEYGAALRFRMGLLFVSVLLLSR
jgi:hypothetical protein